LPKLKDDQDGSGFVTLQSGFGYSPIGMEKLVEGQYTFLHLIYDKSGSVNSFGDTMKILHETLMEACKNLPTVQNLIIRTTTFASGSIQEVHGFKLHADIDPAADYPRFDDCIGGTNLYDAIFSSIEACKKEGDRLYDAGYDVNGVVIIITDGAENISNKIHASSEIAALVTSIKRGEKVNALTTVLVGVKDPKDTQNAAWVSLISVALDDLAKEAKLDKYVDIGDATVKVMTKLAWDISQVTSEVSQRVVSQLVF
jgi:hypothetical protein